jgi:hypothetical protein
MASEILGLFTTPEQYQQNQLAQFQNRAFQEVQLNPFQQAALGARTAGFQLGQGIGSALGGQDPQLQLIARRQQLLSQLDQSDPMSFRRVAKIASDAGDQQLAFGVAEAGRKAEIEMARAAQLGAEKMTSEQRNALVYADSIAPRGSIEHNEAFQSRFDQLTLKAGQANKPFEFEAKEARLQELKSGLRVMENQPVPNKEAIQRLKDSIQAIEGVEKKEKTNIIDVGVAAKTREVVYFDKDSDEQFILKPNASGKLVRTPYSGGIDKTTSKVTATSTSTTGGIKDFKDIPDLRAKIVGVVDPFRKAVNATDFALESLDLSINQNNFSGFNAARVQLAKALSGGDLSQKEIAAAGGDPSILGGLIDATSTAFSGTPSFDTQKKIKDTITAIRKVAIKKGRDEISAQRNIAGRSGFNADDFNAASDIPEFRAGKVKKTITLKSGKTVTVQED